MTDNIAISIREVTKVFQDQTVLDHVSVDFERGKIHGIIGRNGSGKTVLLKCICGFVFPTAGEIVVNQKKVGTDIDFPSEIRFIIETPGFLMNYSGYKNLKYLASIRNKVSKETIRDAISIVGLNPKDKKHVGKYSLGMRQRLGIALAIMEDPGILILDEPMNGLDNEGVADMHRIIKNLRESGKTIILASHNMYDIEDLCDTVNEMDGGTLTNKEEQFKMRTAKMNS